MKSQQKKQQEQKLRRRPKMSKVKQSATVDLGDYSNATSYSIDTSSITNTLTMDSSMWNSNITIDNTSLGIGTSYNWSPQYYTTTDTSSTVYINSNGLTMNEGADITVGGKSLTKTIEQIEERLGILHPNPELEDRWDKLKELRKQYMEMEKDLIEKEKVMKILKES